MEKSKPNVCVLCHGVTNNTDGICDACLNENYVPFDTRELIEWVKGPEFERKMKEL